MMKTDNTELIAGVIVLVIGVMIIIVIPAGWGLIKLVAVLKYIF